MEPAIYLLYSEPYCRESSWVVHSFDRCAIFHRVNKPQGIIRGHSPCLTASWGTGGRHRAVGCVMQVRGAEGLFLRGPTRLSQVQRRVQVLAERAPGAGGAAALLGPADAAQAPQVQPDGRSQVAPEKSHGFLGG